MADTGFEKVGGAHCEMLKITEFCLSFTLNLVIFCQKGRRVHPL